MRTNAGVKKKERYSSHSPWSSIMEWNVCCVFFSFKRFPLFQFLLPACISVSFPHRRFFFPNRLFPFPFSLFIWFRIGWGSHHFGWGWGVRLLSDCPDRDVSQWFPLQNSSKLIRPIWNCIFHVVSGIHFDCENNIFQIDLVLFCFVE